MAQGFESCKTSEGTNTCCLFSYSCQDTYRVYRCLSQVGAVLFSRLLNNNNNNNNNNETKKRT